MTFSPETNQYVAQLAGKCQDAYAFSAPRKAFNWQAILQALLAAITSGCMPASKAEANELPKKWVNKVSKGVKNCCPAAVHKALKEAGVTSATDRDRVFYTVVSTSNHERALAADAIESGGKDAANDAGDDEGE